MTAEAPDIRAEMRLRPERPKVTRLSRKVLIGLAGTASVIVLGTVLWALDGGRRSGEPPQELYRVDNQPTADGLNNLPADYTQLPPDVPVLGPPLPGDLGGPILDAQERGQPVIVPDIRTEVLSREEQARLAEIEAARLSRLFAGVTAPSGGATAQASLPAYTLETAMPDPLLPLDEGSAQNMQDRKLAFLNEVPDIRAVSDEPLIRPASPYLLQAGSIIPAALITGIRSDLPGQITAQVTSPVYDSPSGNHLLIPQGSRLIGRYDSEIAFGQSRVLLVWDRLILPNGKSILLGNQPGTDTMGFAGLEDETDYHWGQIFQSALLSTLLGAVGELGSSGEESEIVAAIRESAQGTAEDIGEQLISRQMNIQPTLTVRPGFLVRILVNRDLVLEPYRE